MAASLKTLQKKKQANKDEISKQLIVYDGYSRNSFDKVIISHMYFFLFDK